MLNSRLDDLMPYPFERLSACRRGIICSQGERLSRPGAPYIRLALVHEAATIAEALTRARRVLN